uniref:Uncharacterized protein n=1 Tax=Acrobeloides nanus TaxID=290746 RepID=A0A914CB80_9BILA
MDLVFTKLFQYFILIGFFIRVFCADDNDSIPRPQYQLNRCFTYKPNSRLKIDEDQVVETTDSIEFKDDCLRSCLKSLIHEAFVCRSLMHTPKDDILLFSKFLKFDLRLESSTFEKLSTTPSMKT